MQRGSLQDPFIALWLLCAVAVGASFLLTPSALPAWDLCWFKSLTHHPCPACGLTHSFLAIGHGRWSEAWSYNPFGFVWYPLALYGLLRPLLKNAAPKIFKKTDGFIGSRYFFPFLVAGMILVWGWRSLA